ncbi:MAG: nitroreductase family protein [Peptococcaceae bacterium]|nr:nitroreductase family protein [Peptococcaceae bacterium]
MNETLKVIKSRRSIRSYKAEQITDSELQEILDAALYAPNAMNLQPWHFTVVQNKDILDRMVKNTKEIMMNSDKDFLVELAKNPNYHTFHNAPTVIIISGDGKDRFAQNSCSIAAQNILLAAESLNIGSCYIASSSLLFESEKGEEFRKELGIPDGYNHVCSIALGYKAAENPAAPPRNKEVINYVR